MILCDLEIKEMAQAGMIEPFSIKNLNPASYDLTLGDKFRVPESGGWSDEVHMPEAGIDLDVFPFILAHSLEYLNMPDNIAAMLYSKSTAGRKGIEHSHAGFIDPGFPGQLTFEVSCLWPFKRIIKPGNKLFQIVFFRMSGKPEKNYMEKSDSHYVNQSGATANYDNGRSSL